KPFFETFDKFIVVKRFVSLEIKGSFKSKTNISVNSCLYPRLQEESSTPDHMSTSSPRLGVIGRITQSHFHQFPFMYSATRGLTQPRTTRAPRVPDSESSGESLNLGHL